MSFCDGKWLFNNEHGGLWNKSDFYDYKAEAERAAMAYFEANGNITGEIYIGQAETVPIPEVRADIILERIDEEYGDECGGEYDDFLFCFSNIKKENLEELENEINSALKKFYEKENIKSDWFHVVNIYKLEKDVRTKIAAPGAKIPEDTGKEN